MFDLGLNGLRESFRLSLSRPREQKQKSPTFLKKGWLIKTGALNTNSMKRRWCVFYEDRTFQYFRTGQQQCLKGTADFSEVLGYNHKGSSFEIITPARVWQFEAANSEEAKSWVKVMLIHSRFQSDEVHTHCDLCQKDLSTLGGSRKCILCARACCFNCCALQPEDAPMRRFLKDRKQEFGVCGPCFPHTAQSEWLGPRSVVEYLNNCTYKWQVGRIKQDNGSWFRVKHRSGETLDVHFSAIRAPRLWLRFERTIQNSGKTELLFRSIYRECRTDKLVNEIGYGAILAVEKNEGLKESIRQGSYTFPVICWCYKPKLLRVQPIDGGARIFLEKFKFPAAMKDMFYRMVAVVCSSGEEIVQEVSVDEALLFTGLENEQTYQFRVSATWNGCTSRDSDLSSAVTPHAGSELVEKWSIVGKMYSCSFSADGQFIVSAGTDCQLRKWKIMEANEHTGKAFKPLIGHASDNWSCICGPLGKRVYSCGNDKTVRIWDAKSGKNLFTFQHDAIVSCLTISVDASRLVAGTWASKLYLYDTDQGVVVQQYDAMKAGSVHCVCLTPHNEYLISGCNKNILVWDVIDCTAELKIEAAHAEKVTCLKAISEKSFASASSDGKLKMWTISGELAHEVNLGHRASALDMMHDRSHLIVGGSKIQVVNTATARIVYSFETPDKLSILSLAINPCDDIPFFVSSFDQTMPWRRRAVNQRSVMLTSSSFFSHTCSTVCMFRFTFYL